MSIETNQHPTPSLGGITPSEDQADAIAQIVERYLAGRAQTTLGGLAGTGKTTILELLKAALGFEPQYLAPTGKAAEVMRQKGLANAETIHSFIYNFQGLSRDENDENPKPIFEDKGDLELDTSLIVVDEASMVNTSLYTDLMEKGYPVLFVGDHGQLAPVGGDPGLMANPDICLERIHRQAEGNPIIQLAHSIRNGGHPANFKCEGDEVQIIRRGGTNKIVSYAMNNNIDQIIVGFNKLRCNINAAYRASLGRSDEQIVVGEKLICLKNNRDRGIFNGMMFEVMEIDGGTATTLDLKLKNLSTGYIADEPHTIARGALLQEKSYDLDLAKQRGQVSKKTSSFDYSYAITGHKSQGSQWDSVLVMWDVCKFWSMELWGYTAVTRAAERVVVAV